MESKAICEEVIIKPRKESTNSNSSDSTTSSIEEEKNNNITTDKIKIDIEYEQLKKTSNNNFEKFVSEIEEVEIPKNLTLVVINQKTYKILYLKTKIEI